MLGSNRFPAQVLKDRQTGQTPFSTVRTTEGSWRRVGSLVLRAKRLARCPTFRVHRLRSTASIAALDSLLSPKHLKRRSLLPRASVAGSDFSNIDASTENDSRFSTVPLSEASERASLVSLKSEPITDVDSPTAITSRDRTPSPSPRSSLHTPGRTWRSTLSKSPSPRPQSSPKPPSLTAVPRLRHFAHKKSASSAFVQELTRGGNIVAGLGAQRQRAHDENDLDALRGAGAGQLLHEEFVRLHNERRAEAAQSEDDIDWDFWGAVISDYQAYAAENPEKLAKAIEKGIPHTLRGMMWQLMAASKDTELENTYLMLLKETSPNEKSITRDLGRTFPHHEFFTDGQGIGQENLFNVLKAYSLYDRQVGYCQGLPFIAAVLLLNMPDEQAFCLLVRLMHSYDLRGHFLPEMPKLQLRLFQFDRLVEELLPVLHVHFLREGVKSSMFCSQWFLTLFSYRFPLEIVFRIYDTCLASGIESIFAFSIALLHKSEHALLKMKFDEILVFLKQRVFESYQSNLEKERTDLSGSQALYEVDAFVEDATSLKITPFMLDTYSREYCESIRRREAHAVEMDNLRNTNRTLAAKVKELDSNLTQLNAEHVQVLNQLVMARLRNEETEQELVHYKLLYAEAMHQNEGAMSSNRSSKSRSSK